MTDSTAHPPADPPLTRATYEIPATVAGAVHVWAAERGISDNAAACLLVRSGLIHATSDPRWLPPNVNLRGTGAEVIRRSITMPVYVTDVLRTWARQQRLPRDVAVTILMVGSLLHSDRVGRPFPILPLTLPSTITPSPDPFTEED